MTYFRSKHVAELNILTLLFDEDSCVETGIGCQLVYIQRTSAQSIYSRVRLHVSTRG